MTSQPDQATKATHKTTTHFPRGWTAAKARAKQCPPATWSCTCGDSGVTGDVDVEAFLRQHRKMASGR